jgi:beta-lactam-binding protein with PASTA domain/serine/threonine protein kinase
MTTSTSDPLVGHVLDGRYHVLDRVARGGMATVYRATDTRLDRVVALKVMHIGLGDDVDFAAKFDREARAAARLSHPHVVSVFDQGSDAGRPYIVMELVEGKTLRTVISREAPLTPLRALSMIEPVLSALASAHDAGLVHRDIKPENVLISERGQIKVGDFGLARAITAQTSTATAGLLIGTVSYLPPELVLSGKADARSDVYSTGVVLFEMLTGRKPHTGETPIQVAYAHVHNDVPAPSSLPTAAPIPDYLDALIARATARNADARPHDARVMLAQVRQVKSALKAGLASDPELCQDLTVPVRTRPSEPAPPQDASTPSIAEDGDEVDPHSITTAIGPTLAAAAAAERVDGPTFSDTPPTSSRPLTAAPYAGESIRSGAPAQQQWPAPDAELTEHQEYTPTDIRYLSGPSTPAGPQEDSEPLPVRTTRPNRPLRRNRHRVRGWIALILVLLLTISAAAAGWYLVKGRFTTAPALTSLTEQRATSIARESGLSVDFSRSFSETVEKGVVIDTRPRPGGKVLRGGTIDAVVSKGPERYPMPKVVGLPQSEAEDKITDRNLAVGDVTDKYSEKVEKDAVISASSDPGSKLKRDTEIDLVVSKGRQPIEIGDYTGQSVDQASNELEQAGFTVKINEEHSASVAAGQVIRQSPDEGTGFRNDTIELTESLGPVMVTVPNVKSMGERAARKVLQDKGFDVRTENSSILHLGLGFVESTDPDGGSKAPEGSTITLYLV